MALCAREPVSRRSTPAVAQLLEARTLLSSIWENVQIGGGGYVTGLASSTTGDAIYARTDVGGAYRWEAASTQWRPITDSLPSDINNNGSLYGIGSIAVDPNNANRVFISAGKYNWSNPSGIYVCNDTSAPHPTWTVIDSTIRVIGNGGARPLGERLLVDPNNSNVVYYGTNNISGGGAGLKKLYFDTAWQTVGVTTPAIGDVDYGITFVAADKNGGTVSDGVRTVSKYLYIGVYSGTTGSGGVYASSNGGASWTKVAGVAVDKPNRGEVGPDGTLYVTFDGTFASNGGVVKLARGSAAFTSIAPGGNLNYCGLAVDPSVAGTVMVARHTGSNATWRSVNSGDNWVLVNRTIHAGEPDGTPSTTGNGTTDHISDLLINPADLDEVWASDFLGISRTQNIKDDATASDWYLLQRNFEEVVPLDLKSAPGGAPLLNGVADVNGFVHDDPAVRPAPSDKFETPAYLSTTSLDFSEATSGATSVWARVGDIFYTTYTDSDRTGGISLDGGRNWAAFGQLDSKSILNTTTAGWEAWDVGPYLQQQKAASANLVTLVVRSSAWQTNQQYLRFSSKEGGNAPLVLVNGSTPLVTTADSWVNKGSQSSNYGNSTELRAQNYYEQNAYTSWIYLKFDLSSVASISSATLKLYRLAGNGSYSFPTSVHATPTTNWIEGNGGTDNNPAGEITWANRPVDLYAPPAGATGGRIAVSATDPAKMVWVAENGYVWYSNDRAVSWTRATLAGASLTVDTMTEFEVAKVALTSDRVAADTFYLYSKTGGGTVYRSTNGGATWSSIVSSIGTANSYKIESLPGVSGRFWFVDHNWNAAAHFKYWNGTSMVNVPGITNAVDFTFGKAVPGQSNPVVYARKTDGTYWYSTNATAGATFTWTKIDVPAIGDAPAVMEGDRQTLGRFYVGTGGRGIFFVDASIPYDATPPVLSEVKIAEGLIQRSMVRQIDLTFDENVTIDAGAVSVLDRRARALSGISAILTPLTARTYRLTFTGAAIIGDSLPDGLYKLLVKGSGVRDAAGNTMTADRVTNFHRLFGDVDGDRDVDSTDLQQFKRSLNRTLQYAWYFDFDGNQAVNALDLAQMKKRLVRRPL